jgi:hypothetical protein
MAEAFFLPLGIVACPIGREADGLAMSSRNTRLDAQQRAQAPGLFRALQSAGSAAQAREQLQQLGFDVDYVEDLHGRRLGAVRLGGVRLIDNVAIGCSPRPVNILLLMSGSIACAKASNLVSAWVKQGHQVQVACTPSVAEFIGHATLEGFSGRPVLGSAFTPGQVMDHIHLARWADVVVAAPATSNLINKFAAGLADDVVTSLWQASYGRASPCSSCRQ